MRLCPLIRRRQSAWAKAWSSGSAQATHFKSLEELVHFIVRVLHEAGEGAPRPVHAETSDSGQPTPGSKPKEGTMQPIEMALEAALIVMQHGGSTVAADRTFTNILTGYKQEGVLGRMADSISSRQPGGTGEVWLLPLWRWVLGSVFAPCFRPEGSPSLL